MLYADDFDYLKLRGHSRFDVNILFMEEVNQVLQAVKWFAPNKKEIYGDDWHCFWLEVPNPPGMSELRRGQLKPSMLFMN
ncbi:MAG: hypothetical protein LBR25_05030 [Erysipelotrichaceae bacterium]|jgi:hypothetical protein|nr:hypothetical protein [Erysipelotrichaceae bacterium]